MGVHGYNLPARSRSWVFKVFLAFCTSLSFILSLRTVCCSIFLPLHPVFICLSVSVCLSSSLSPSLSLSVSFSLILCCSWYVLACMSGIIRNIFVACRWHPSPPPPPSPLPALLIVFRHFLLSLCLPCCLLRVTGIVSCHSDLYIDNCHIEDNLTAGIPL